MSEENLRIKTRDKSFKSSWELEQRIFCVEHYFRSGSFKQVHSLFCKQFNTDTVPHKTCIQKWVLKFRKFGNLGNLPVSTQSLSHNSSASQPSPLNRMSSQKGNVNRSRAQKHQNREAFKNDKYDKSKKTKALNDLETTDVCERCKAVLEWKVKYKKYKVLKQPAVCTKCKGKTVTKSYHNVCPPCAQRLKICPKCNKPESEWSLNSHISQNDLVSNSDEDNKRGANDLPDDDDDGEPQPDQIDEVDVGDKNEGWRGWLFT